MPYHITLSDIMPYHIVVSFFCLFVILNHILIQLILSPESDHVVWYWLHQVKKYIFTYSCIVLYEVLWRYISAWPSKRHSCEFSQGSVQTQGLKSVGCNGRRKRRGIHSYCGLIFLQWGYKHAIKQLFHGFCMVTVWLLHIGISAGSHSHCPSRITRTWKSLIF